MYLPLPLFSFLGDGGRRFGSSMSSRHDVSASFPKQCACQSRTAPTPKAVSPNIAFLSELHFDGVMLLRAFQLPWWWTALWRCGLLYT